MPWKCGRKCLAVNFVLVGIESFSAFENMKIAFVWYCERSKNCKLWTMSCSLVHNTTSTIPTKFVYTLISSALAGENFVETAYECRIILAKAEREIKREIGHNSMGILCWKFVIIDQNPSRYDMKTMPKSFDQFWWLNFSTANELL